MYYAIKPIAKPRMTRADKWKERPAVLRYRAFKDEVRLNNIQIPVPCKLIFFIEMPKSWSKKLRVEQDGAPHQQAPDIDNLIKGLFDAIYTEDAHIWGVHAEKRWAQVPGMIVEAL